MWFFVMLKKIFSKLPRLLLLAALLVAIAYLHGNRSHSKGSVAQPECDLGVHSVFSLTDIQHIFPSAFHAKPSGVDSSVVFVYDVDKVLLGKVICSSPYADSIIGYAGSTPLLVGLNCGDTVVGVSMLRNVESPGFIRKIEKRGFFKIWNNLPVSEAYGMPVDAMAGATYSTTAIIKNMQVCVGRYLSSGKIPPEHLPFDWMSFLKFAASILVVLFALLSFFFTKQLRKGRNYLLSSAVLIIGLWGGSFLSAALLYGWLVDGFPLLLCTIFVLAVILPLVTGKAFYCNYLCPFGACQELAGKIFPWKLEIPIRVARWLRWLRPLFFASVLILLLVGFSVDLTELEPFSIFAYQTVSAIVMVMAIFFIIVSLVIPKPWCRFFCPTGEFLELIRKPGKPWGRIQRKE